MQKMFRLLASSVIALSCVATPCLATPSNGGQPNKSQQTTGAKKKKAKKNKGRRSAKKNGRLFTKTRVLVAGALAVCMGGGVYWWLYPDQVNGWLASLKTKILGNSTEQKIEELKKTDPKAADDLEKKIQKFKKDYEVKELDLQEKLTTANANEKVALEAKKNAEQKVVELEVKVKQAENAAGLDKASLEGQLTAQRALAADWQVKATSCNVEKEKLNAQYDQLNLNYQNAVQSLKDNVQLIANSKSQNENLAKLLESERNNNKVLQLNLDKALDGQKVKTLEGEKTKLENEKTRLDSELKIANENLEKARQNGIELPKKVKEVEDLTSKFNAADASVKQKDQEINLFKAKYLKWKQKVVVAKQPNRAKQFFNKVGDSILMVTDGVAEKLKNKFGKNDQQKTSSQEKNVVESNLPKVPETQNNQNGNLQVIEKQEEKKPNEVKDDKQVDTNGSGDSGKKDDKAVWYNPLTWF